MNESQAVKLALEHHVVGMSQHGWAPAWNQPGQTACEDTVEHNSRHPMERRDLRGSHRTADEALYRTSHPSTGVSHLSDMSWQEIPSLQRWWGGVRSEYPGAKSFSESWNGQLVSIGNHISGGIKTAHVATYIIVPVMSMFATKPLRLGDSTSVRFDRTRRMTLGLESDRAVAGLVVGSTAAADFSICCALW